MIAGGVQPPSAAGQSADDATLASEANELLGRIASGPRFAGSESESRARGICATLLAENGFAVSEQPFSFSEFPARWGVPIVALILAAFALATIYVFSDHGGALPALAFFGLGLLIVRVLSHWLTRREAMGMRWMRSRSTNLVALRGSPSVWLVAHLDSKSQTIPMLVRIASIVFVAVLAVLLMGALVFELVRPSGNRDSFAIVVLGEALALALVPLVLCLTRDRSHGAVDNASGVISVILAAGRLRSQANLGVIIMSGEELALAGARAFTEAHADHAIALNCDTVDDDGEFRCMVRGARGPAAGAVERAGSRLGLDVRATGIIPGILADSIAFTDAGWDAVTLSRGNIATLARVHTSSDTRQRLNGLGIAKAARLLAATVEELS